MGIEVAGAAVCRPACMRQANASAGRLIAERALEICYLAGPLLDEEVALVSHQGDPGGVVTPVLEAPEPVHQNWSGLSRSGVSDDAAHTRIHSRSRGPRPPGVACRRGNREGR